MADDQDELAALYGDIEPQQTDVAAGAGAQLNSVAQAAVAVEDDDSLFAQLYGDQPASEEPIAKPFNPYEAAKAQVQGKYNYIQH